MNSKWRVFAELFTPPVLHFHPRASDTENKRYSSTKRLPFKIRCCQVLSTVNSLSTLCFPSLRQLTPTLDFSRNRTLSYQCQWMRNTFCTSQRSGNKVPVRSSLVLWRAFLARERFIFLS